MAWNRRKQQGAAQEPRARRAPAELTPVTPVAPGSLGHAEIVELLRRDLVEISGGELSVEQVDPAGHLFDFGYVDSLSAVVFLERIEQRFAVHVEDYEVVEARTSVDALARRIGGAA